MFRFHKCFQPGLKRYITIPKGEAKLNRLICKWSLAWAGFCANQLSRCFPVLACIHILFVNVYAWLSLRLVRVSSYPLLMCYLWFHSLRRSPRRHSACSLWPAALRSSLHTTSPENFWPGSPRSSCRPRPGLSAPSRTRTESCELSGKKYALGYTLKGNKLWVFTCLTCCIRRIRLCLTEGTGILLPSRLHSVRRSPSHRALSKTNNLNIKKKNISCR